MSAHRPAWQTLTLVIVCGCILAILSSGPRNAMGLFLAPMTEARGWSREIFALALAIQNLMWGLGQPFAGALADRYGTARVLAGGGVLYGLGLALTGQAESTLALHLTAGLLMGIGMAAASFSLVLAALGRFVTPEQRTLAFGVGTAAASMGQFLFAPLGQALIETYGWQQALTLLGVMMLAIPLFAFAIKGKPDSLATIGGHDQSIAQALAEAFNHRSFVLLVAGFFVCGFHVSFITVHLPPYIVDLGIEAKYGAYAIAIIGLFNVIGALASGILAGRYSKPIFLALIYLARSAAIALFILLPATPVTVLLFSGVIGLLWLSTVPPTSGLVAVMFGPRYMATLFGFVFFSHQVGAFLGVWLGGRLYDQYQSYDVVWWLGVVLGVVAALLHWPISERPVERAAAA